MAPKAEPHIKPIAFIVTVHTRQAVPHHHPVNTSVTRSVILRVTGDMGVPRSAERTFSMDGFIEVAGVQRG
jgi:hypothetical protein